MKNLMKTAIFLILLLFFITILENIFKPDFVTYRFISGFKQEPQNTIDVLNIGDSDMYYDISPMQMFKDYGITSYNFSSPAISNISAYYLMLEAVKTQSPKVVIMDATEIFNFPESENTVHYITDGLNDNDIKQQLINDKALNFTGKEKIGLKYPFYRYHDNWAKHNTISQNKFDFSSYYFLKGFLNSGAKKKTENVDFYSKYDKNYCDSLAPTVVADYIIKSRDYCKKHNISFLLISLPDKKYWDCNKSIATKKWCKKNNVNYLDFNDYLQKINVDYETDSADGGEHLNVSGATKLSKFLGKYLNDNYILPDHRGDKNYHTWNDNIAKYDDATKFSYSMIEKSNS
jgi:hypothetical protein